MSLNIPRDTHLAMSSWIAQAALCGWKFRLGLIFGVPGGGNRGSLAGFFVHQVLSRAGETIERVWHSGGTESSIVDQLAGELNPVQALVLPEWRKDLEDRYESVDFDAHRIVAEMRLRGIVEGLAQYMARREPPRKVLNELQIMDPHTHHEGRLDAIFEWDDRCATVDFKTYSDEAPRSHGYDHLQIVANGMLANYRYGRPGTDFTNNELVIIYTGGLYFPRPTQRMVERVTSARDYVLGCLQSSQSHEAQTLNRYACQFCEKQDACGFYRTIERLHRTGQLADADEELRRSTWRRRYAILDYRQISHKNKFTVALNQLRLLEQYKVLETGYSLGPSSPNANSMLLIRRGGSNAFLEGDAVRIIGLEPGRPIMGSINFNGSVEVVSQQGVEVGLTGRPVSDVCRLLNGLPIALMRTEVDLTKRELQALDYIQRRASPTVREIAEALLGEE